MRNSWNLSAGVKQFVFQKRGSITLNVTDAFWKSYPRGLTQFGDVTEDWTSIRDTRVVNLGITYNFGKGKAGRMRRNCLLYTSIIAIKSEGWFTLVYFKIIHCSRKIKIKALEINICFP